MAEQIFGVTLRLSTCKTCGEIALDGNHELAIAALEAQFMDAGGTSAQLADEVRRRRIEFHPFVPKEIPVRWVGEQHVNEDLGYIPSFADWARAIELAPWMVRSRKLSLELDLKRELRLVPVPSEKEDANV
jgi:hypothetical protein